MPEQQVIQITYDGPLPGVRKEIVSRVENGEHFALDLGNGEIFDMNETASYVLDACRKGTSLRALLQDMQARYDGVTEAELKKDVAELLNAFAGNGFFG